MVAAAVVAVEVEAPRTGNSLQPRDLPERNSNRRLSLHRPGDLRRDIVGSMQCALGENLRLRLPLAGQMSNNIRLVKTLNSLLAKLHAPKLPMMV